MAMTALASQLAPQNRELKGSMHEDVIKVVKENVVVLVVEAEVIALETRTI